ncbi:DoxX family protein [Myceligenerans indicum]|uniref:DoxX family protein n=1 Tax=Myceligenerans indicum TaxID=2593663 RepID=A0ABS1LJ45_9MICO|nr:DoxX family protein [Myceligenerans indicum]MBL0886260.1 DoxX family protein [Myceligenerans indicum]
MTIAYWIVAGITALAFLAAGTMKASRSKEALAASGMGWVEDFAGPGVRLIGVAEIAGGIGLIVPMLIGVVPALGPVAAIALALTMIGAVVVHIRRKEPAIPALVLLVLAGSAAVLGFMLV